MSVRSFAESTSNVQGVPNHGYTHLRFQIIKAIEPLRGTERLMMDRSEHQATHRATAWANPSIERGWQLAVVDREGTPVEVFLVVSSEAVGRERVMYLERKAPQQPEPA